MNVYDFDKTIYRGDSTLDFYFYALKKKPSLVRYMPLQGIYFVIYSLGMMSKTRFKEGFYCFLKGIGDVEGLVAQFWEGARTDIDSWYPQQQKEDDVVISASPRFLLDPICRELGIKHLIASIVEPNTGVYSGTNCYGEEKVRRFEKEFPGAAIDSFYSDSRSDEPLAALSREAFIVGKNGIEPWPQTHKENAKTIFLSSQFFGFLIIGGINTFNGVFFAWLFSLLWTPIAAWVVGYVCALTVAYLLNSFLIFRKSLSLFRYVRFCISYIPNFLVQLACVYIIVTLLQWHELIAYALAAIIGVPVTFLMLKLYAFIKD